MSLKKILENKNLIINSLFLNVSQKLELSLNEFLILVYFDNLVNKSFDIKQMTDIIKLDESTALIAFNKLIDKKLISIDAQKNSAGKIDEKVNLDGFYSLIVEDFKNNSSHNKKDDIYGVFEKEFARPISSMEYEIINAWLDKSFTEELILGALKEAVYNGVTNLRYIDKILYEWQRKGFKSMQDVNKHLSNRTTKVKQLDEENNLFDYNWLDEDNE